MAPVTPPVNLQAASYSARMDRLAMAGLLTPAAVIGPLAGRGGVRPYAANTSLKVQQRATPDRWVTILPGTCWISATSALGGVYQCHNDASYDVQLATPHATLARKDLLVARVYDAIDDTGTQNLFAIESVTGTPAASPAVPAVPGQALALAEVTVAANATAITDANIVDRRARTVALGGVLPVAGATEMPTTPYPGMKIYRSDLNQEQIWDGTAWRVISYGAFTGYTPTLTGSVTNPTMGTGGIRTGSFFQLGKLTVAYGTIKFGTSGAAAGSGTYRISLPTPAKALVVTGQMSGTCYGFDVSANNSNSGVCVIDSTDTSRIIPTLAGNWVTGAAPWTWGNNDELSYSVVYEAA